MRSLDANDHFQRLARLLNLESTAEAQRILDDLKKGFRKNQKTWKRLLEQLPPEGE